MFLKYLQVLKNNSRYLITILVLFSLALRLWQITYPKGDVFDEVYYPFTAREYLKGNKDAWDFGSKAPEGHSFAWVNPPLPQEIMALSMWVFRSTDNWAPRIPGAILGSFSVYLVYLLGKKLFSSEAIGLISAFAFSFDGLNFVQSRIGMLDIYLTTFILASVLFLVRKNIFLSAIFFGLAFSCKWTALYILPLFIFFLIRNRDFLRIFYYIFIPPIIYLLVYTPLFLLGFDFNYFISLLKQEWGYHMSLKATHDYASAWWSWPLNLYPVWYFVEYHEGNIISNIFAVGNPMVFWFGTAAIILSLFEYLLYIYERISHLLKASKNFLKEVFTAFFNSKNEGQTIVLGTFFLLWLPWAISPRIMFFYYFTPAVPFLCLALGYQLVQLNKQEKNPLLVTSVLLLIFLGFLLSYPLFVGMPIPKNLLEIFFKTNFAKNPFAT